jgi:hypothetical protein
MNEDRVRDFIRRAGTAPGATEAEWDAFRNRARRDLFVHRAGTAVMAAAVIVAAALGSRAVLDDRALPPTPPAEQQHEPRPPAEWPTDPVVAERCQAAPDFVPKGARGALVYVTGSQLRVRDLTSGQDWTVATGIPDRVDPGDVGASPDGDWVTFGEGVVVPTLGGDICRPLGVYGFNPMWSADGTMLANAEGVLITGSPTRGGDPQIHTGDQSDSFYGAVLDPARRTAAFTWTTVADDRFTPVRASVALLDVASGEYRRIYDSPDDDVESFGLQIESWSPDGSWIIARKFTRGASASADPTPLVAIEVTTGRAVDVTDETNGAPVTIAFGDRVAWCDDRLVVAEGVARFSDDAGRVVVAAAPSWVASEILPAPDGHAFSHPSCLDGRLVMSTGPLNKLGQPDPTGVVVVGDVAPGDGGPFPVYGDEDDPLASPQWIRPGEIVVEERHMGETWVGSLRPEGGIRERFVGLGDIRGFEFGATAASQRYFWISP